MIYIAEMGFADPSRLAEWHTHYLRNIANLQTVPGFLASQRFEAVTEMPSPYAALHQIASPEVFTSAEYRARGGPKSNGTWQPLMINWHRNLYAGLDAPPEVADGAYLLLVDAPREIAEREIALPAGVRIHWLTCVGLDRSIPHRGIAVLEDVDAMVTTARSDKRAKVFRPMTKKIWQGMAD